MPITSVRLDATTHREPKKLSTSLGISTSDTVALAVRRLRQERMGAELAADLTSEESSWLGVGVLSTGSPGKVGT